MARLTTSARKALPKSAFALPKSAGSGKAGRGSYPIENPSHARNALARVAQNGTPAQVATVKAKVAKKFPSIAQGGKKSSKPRAPKAPTGDGMDHDGFMSLGHNDGAWK